MTDDGYRRKLRSGFSRSLIFWVLFKCNLRVKTRHWVEWVPKISGGTDTNTLSIPCSEMLRAKFWRVPRDRGPPGLPVANDWGTGTGGSRGLSQSCPAALPPCHPFSTRLSERSRRKKGFPSLLSRPENQGSQTSAHLRAASAAGLRALTIVLVAVPPPRHATRWCSAELRHRSRSAAGTVRPPASGSTAARRAEWPARRRSRSRRLPEAQGRMAGWLRELGSRRAGFESSPGRWLLPRTQRPSRVTSASWLLPSPAFAESPSGATRRAPPLPPGRTPQVASYARRRVV